jgi:ribosomal protein S18 acetylase RimI-like enzyme
MEPISDTALSLGGKPRTPSPEKTFIPVGHISLDAGSHPEEPFEADSYRISTFYISSALQGAGLGNAAMDAVESMAINEPLNAKILWLCTISNTQEEQPGKWEALGRKPGTVS